VDPMIEVHPHPRATSIGVRSMEHFRRLGLDARVIDAGVPRSQALDVVYVTRVLAREIHRFRFPSIEALFAERSRWAGAIPEVALSPYFKTWTAQSPLERMLRDHLAGLPRVATRYGWRLEAFAERSDRVDVTLRCDADGRRETVRTRYLVGCDGVQSAVRAGLGIEYEGRGTLGQALGIHFRAPELIEKPRRLARGARNRGRGTGGAGRPRGGGRAAAAQAETLCTDRRPPRLPLRRLAAGCSRRHRGAPV